MDSKRQSPSPANIVIMAGAVVMLIGSFLKFFKAGSIDFNAWSTDLFAPVTLIPVLIGVVMAAHVAVETFGGPKLPDRVLGFTWNQLHLVLGGQATLMVRPERVRISMDAPTGDVATVRATVRDLTFQGPVVRMSLAAPDDSTILAHIGPEQDLPMLRPGDEVHVCWAPDASLVLPAADIPTTEDLEEMLDDS